MSRHTYPTDGIADRDVIASADPLGLVAQRSDCFVVPYRTVDDLLAIVALHPRSCLVVGDELSRRDAEGLIAEATTGNVALGFSPKEGLNLTSSAAGLRHLLYSPRGFGQVAGPHGIVDVISGEAHDIHSLLRRPHSIVALAGHGDGAHMPLPGGPLCTLVRPGERFCAGRELANEPDGCISADAVVAEVVVLAACSGSGRGRAVLFDDRASLAARLVASGNVGAVIAPFGGLASDPEAVAILALALLAAGTPFGEVVLQLNKETGRDGVWVLLGRPEASLIPVETGTVGGAWTHPGVSDAVPVLRSSDPLAVSAFLAPVPSGRVVGLTNSDDFSVHAAGDSDEVSNALAALGHASSLAETRRLLQGASGRAAGQSLLDIRARTDSFFELNCRIGANKLNKRSFMTWEEDASALAGDVNGQWRSLHHGLLSFATAWWCRFGCQLHPLYGRESELENTSSVECAGCGGEEVRTVSRLLTAPTSRRWMRCLDCGAEADWDAEGERLVVDVPNRIRRNAAAQWALTGLNGSDFGFVMFGVQPPGVRIPLATATVPGCTADVTCPSVVPSGPAYAVSVFAIDGRLGIARRPVDIE